MKLIFLLLSACVALSYANRVELGANPIRKVVVMLQNMQKKVEAEGDKDKELHEKAHCACKTSVANLNKSIDEANLRIPQVEAQIKEFTASKDQLKADLADHKKDREDAQNDLAKVTKMRSKAAEAFAKQSSEAKTNIRAVGKAVKAIEKGAGAFLQTDAPNQLKKVVLSATLNEEDRQVLVSFLENKVVESGGSGEIVGILKQMLEQMEKDLAEDTATENDEIAEFKSLKTSKQQEISAATKAIESKTARYGESSVALVQAENDSEDTQDALTEDSKMLRETTKSCANKDKEYDARVALRADEVTAISDTIKILNDDDTLDLFNKAAPSLIQIDDESESRQQALAFIQQLKTTTRSTTLDLISMALKGKKAGLEKVLTMIEDMAVLLKKEQVDDNKKKEYCNDSLDSAQDSKTSLARDVKDAKGSIAESTDAVANLQSEIKALQAGIAALDKSVAEAGEQRKEEHSEYTEVVTNNSQVKQVLEFAKNRLNKFYNPNLYKPPAKRELTEEEKLFVDGGGVLPSEAPGGIAGTGIGAFAQKQESSGVIRMMDMMINDVNSELQKAELEEKEAQQDYDELLADAKNKKAADNKSVTEKSVALAETEQELQGHKQVLTAKGKEFTSTITTIQDLHKECDFLLQNFDMRKEARTNEIEGLKKAQAVLNGADFSLLQRRSFLAPRVVISV